MTDKLKKIQQALNSIEKHGWCNLTKSDIDTIETVKYLAMITGNRYETHEYEHSIMIFVSENKLKKGEF